MTFKHLNRFRRLHKWLMLIVGIQFLFWSLGGLYFSVFDIHFIHGESLVKEPEDIAIEDIHYDIHELLQDYPDAKDIELYSLFGQPHFKFQSKHKSEINMDANDNSDIQVINASNKEKLGNLTEAQATHVAHAYYSASSAIADIKLITREAPDELSPRHLPVWQVRFDDIWFGTLYISQITGKVVTKRHVWWRTFDVFWQLHILDVPDGADVNNILLTTAASLAMITTLAGMILTWVLVVSPTTRRRS